jgi:hypothetical protein
MHNQKISKHSVVVGSEPFRIGFSKGLTRKDGRFDLRAPISEERVVSIVRNLTELAADGELIEEHLLHDCGLLTAYIIAAMDARA